MKKFEKDISSYLQCYKQAEIIVNNPEVFKNWNNITDVELLAEILYNLKQEKEERSQLTDSLIDYNDEIVEIIELEEQDVMDITVSADNLFYANDILTKNSHGIAVTSDLMFGLISTPELEQLGHLRIKQLKNRFNSIYMPASFLVGIARAKMTLFDVDMPQTKILVGSKTEQEEIDNSKSISQQNNNINNKPLATPSLNNKPTLKTNLKF